MDAFFYSYLVGGICFLVGLGYAYRQGYVGLSGAGLRNLVISLAVLLVYMGLQGFLQYGPMESAPPQPYDGGADHVVENGGKVRGQPIDYVIVGAYFALILVVGTWFGRRQKTTKDFFFGGQRFAWWLIAFSLVASTVGSYSFVKYSQMGYEYGLSSSQTYWNDWVWFPLLAFGWLPIIYFSRIISIPEYFGRRFGPNVRMWATIYLLIYLVGYVGVNLFTMGKVLNLLIPDLPIWGAAMIVAIISATYVTAGGQTSVIMTDLLQGVMLLFVGFVILFLGISYLGGFESFWQYLPREARLAFPNFNENGQFPSVGIFWQDAIAGSAMLYFLNQGMVMRFLAAKSLAESRKALIATIVVLMFVASLVVASGGWIARAFVGAGVLPDTISSEEAFFIATDLLSRPGMFGLVLAALTAALMSTVDTLITGVSAVVVNDIYRPYIRPMATEKNLLGAARISAVSVTVLGVILVPIFMQFDSIYVAHAAFTAAITPPLVVTLLLSVFWRRFTRPAAVWTLIGGMVALALSLILPDVITPLAHGVPMGDAGDGILPGMKQHKFMRAFYGIVVCGVLGVVVTLFTRPESEERQRGLVWGTISHALAKYKGSPGKESPVTRALAMPRVCQETLPKYGSADVVSVKISREVAKDLEARLGDLIYITDARWWTGGLHSTHAVICEIDDGISDAVVDMMPDTFDSVVVGKRKTQPVRIERLYESTSEISAGETQIASKASEST